MNALLFRAVEALPLGAFLLYIAVDRPRVPLDWRTPYYMATGLAIAVILLLIRRGAILNRIYLGIALYFLSGSVALFIRWPWINEIYGRLEGTAMLFWVCAMGLAFTLFSRHGYVGVDAPAPTVRLWSWRLLAITFGATLVSLAFIGNPLMSAFLPFISIFAAQGLIQARLHLQRSA